MKGKNNIAIGFLTMGTFMAYGFLLIYLRDFAPGKEEWVDDRELKVKKTSTYSLAAINFFNEGNYKIVITNADDQTKILATGTFTINK